MNLVTGQARVVFDSAVAEPQQFVAAVEAVGYGAEIPAREASAVAAEEARDRAQAAEYRSLAAKAAVAGALGLVTMAFGSAPWLLLGITAFVMVWAGRDFYTNGISALLHRAPNMNTLIAVGTGAAFLYSLVATACAIVFTSGRRQGRRLLRGRGHHHRAHPRR